jgi:hypothetical protein
VIEVTNEMAQELFNERGGNMEKRAPVAYVIDPDFNKELSNTVTAFCEDGDALGTIAYRPHLIGRSDTVNRHGLFLC